MTQRTYWLTFRIAKVQSDDIRRRMLIEYIDDISAGEGGSWIEPTSFILFRTTKPVLEIINALNAIILPKHDIVAISPMATTALFVVGKAEDANLFKLWPSHRKV